MFIEISKDFPDRNLFVELGVIRADVGVAPSSPDLISQLDRTVEARLVAFGSNPASSDPQIAAARKAYKALGKDPARYRPAAEALTRRLLQGKGIYHVNNVVDVNNLISIKSGISVGTYVTSSIEGGIVFRRATEGESYNGIGRGPLNLEGLPVFSDGLGPFGCPTSDSERTMIRDGNHQIMMVLICFTHTPDLQEWLNETVDLLKAYCEASNVEITKVTA